MSKLKIEFQKPKLTLCNTNYTPLGILTNKTHMSAYNITLTSKVNETPSLSFDIPLGGLIDNNSTELLVKHKNDYFVIKNISVTSGDTSSVTVNAEHIACELKGIVVSYFEDLIGESPENMWETIITNCSMPEVIRSRYIFETNIVDTYRYLSGEDEKSIYEHLVDIAEQFEACLLFSTDADGIIHIKLLYGDIDRGKFIRKGKDLKQLNLNFSTDSLFTKVTPFGATSDDGIELTIIDVNNGKSYITNYDYYLAKGMTAEEIRNNPLCNQECVYRNADIVDARDLLRLGRQELDKLSKPIVNGTIEAIDLNVFEGSLYLSPILCEKIIVIDKDINYSISCKITEIEFTYDNPLESKIGISNVVRYSTALKDLIKNSEAIGEILTNGLNGRPNLNANKVKGLIDGHIAQLKYSMENNITDVTDAVILFENRIEGNNELFGALAIGSRGILISRELDPITNQWAWTTALDAHGLSTQVVNAIEINASQIKGDTLSSYDNSTWINLNNGEFNFKDKIKYVNNEFRISLNSGGTLEDFVTQYEKDKQDMANDINDVSQEVTNIKDNIDVVISDGIITEAEVVSIEKSIMQLQKEKLDIDTRYNSMSNNSYLDSDLKITLISSYNNYTKAHKNFVDFIRNIITDRKITERERADLDTYSSSYNTTLATLKADMDACLSNIAENNTAYQINNLKTQIDLDFKDVNDRLNTIMDDVGGAVADGIIEEAEILIIQNSINQLNKEKEDVDMIYNTLYNNDDVPSDIKRNLKTKYDEYVAIHRNLITFINNMVSDKVATEQEKATFNNLSSSYSTKLAEFKNAANIALVMANKNYTDTQFNVLDGKIEMRVTSQEVKGLINTNLEESKAYSDTLFQGFQEQIDGVIETYYQSTDPSTSWTTNELKTKHTGDIWHDNLNNATYRWSGIGWQKLTNAEAEQAYALATSKAKVFTSQPTTPYYKGDLWVQGSSGDIMKCIYTRTSGNYSSSDWAKASKYTDDTKANQVASDLANNYYTITQTDSAITVAKESIELGVSEKVETIYKSIDDMEIGGRNLIRNSAFVNGASYWNFGQNVTLNTSKTFNGHPAVKIPQSGLTYNEWRGCRNEYLPITNPISSNQTYTISCYYYVEDISTFDSNIGLEVKGVKTTDTYDTHICSISVPKENLVSNKWTKIVGTFTVTNEYSSTFVLAWVAKNGTVWFADFKLEKGDKCTDWSAAPEDAEDSTGAVKDNLANNYYTKSETEGKIKVASNNITSTVSNNYVTKDTFNNKTSTLATKSELTQTSDNITAKFTSSGGSNLLKNSDAKNGRYMWSGNGATLTIGTSGATPFLGGNEFNSTFPNGLKYGESIKLKANTHYVYEAWIYCDTSFSGDEVKPLHYWCRSTPNTSGVTRLEVRDYRQNITGGVFNKCYVHFKTTSGDVYFTPFVYGGPDGKKVAVRQLSLTEGRVEKAWTPHPSEIYEGSTVIDSSGVTVNNGALTVKDNNGNKVLYGDSSGNLYLKGYLQGIDKQVKLIGDTMKIDGRDGVLRFQYDPENYLYINKLGCSFYSTNSYAQKAANYFPPSIHVDTKGHAIFSGAMGMLKILNNSTYPDLQARNSSDGAYIRMCASSFEVSSKKEFKENIGSINSDVVIDVIKKNNIKTYNLISERKSLDSLEEEAQEKGIELEYEMITPDTKMGLIVEDLTDDAKDLLFASNSDGIDLYNMSSILWVVTQKQQETIEQQETIIKEQQQKLLSLEERLNKLEKCYYDKIKEEK